MQSETYLRFKDTNDSQKRSSSCILYLGVIDVSELSIKITSPCVEYGRLEKSYVSRSLLTGELHTQHSAGSVKLPTSHGRRTLSYTRRRLQLPQKIFLHFAVLPFVFAEKS